MIGRAEDLEWIAASITRVAGAGSPSNLVLLVGPEGIGRRTLLRALPHVSGSLPRFADGIGVTPLILPEDRLEDVEQAIWEEFYESVDPAYDSRRRRHRDLASIEALVVLPAAAARPGLLERIGEMMPESVICAPVSREEADGLAGTRITIEGLSTDDSLELFARTYGAPPPEGARADLLALCERAGGNPRQIESLASRARDDTRGNAERLADWAREAAAPPDVKGP